MFVSSARPNCPAVCTIHTYPDIRYAPPALHRDVEEEGGGGGSCEPVFGRIRYLRSRCLTVHVQGCTAVSTGRFKGNVHSGGGEGGLLSVSAAQTLIRLDSTRFVAKRFPSNASRFHESSDSRRQSDERLSIINQARLWSKPPIQAQAREGCYLKKKKKSLQSSRLA